MANIMHSHGWHWWVDCCKNVKSWYMAKNNVSYRGAESPCLSGIRLSFFLNLCQFICIANSWTEDGKVAVENREIINFCWLTSNGCIHQRQKTNCTPKIPSMLMANCWIQWSRLRERWGKHGEPPYLYYLSGQYTVSVDAPTCQTWNGKPWITHIFANQGNAQEKRRENNNHHDDWKPLGLYIYICCTESTW